MMYIYASVSVNMESREKDRKSVEVDRTKIRRSETFKILKCTTSKSKSLPCFKDIPENKKKIRARKEKKDCISHAVLYEAPRSTITKSRSFPLLKHDSGQKITLSPKGKSSKSKRSRKKRNPYKHSNRQLGAKLIAIFELVVAFALASAVWLAWMDPSTFFSNRKFLRLRHWRFLLPYRYIFEIGLVFVRAVFSAISSVFLLYGAQTRSILVCRLYLVVCNFFLGFHYAFLGACIIKDEPYITFVTFPEILLRPYTVWTVVEFLGEVHYYKRKYQKIKVKQDEVTKNFNVVLDD